MEPTTSITKYVVIGVILLAACIGCYLLIRNPERRKKVFGYIKKKLGFVKNKVKKTKQIAAITAAIRKLPADELDMLHKSCTEKGKPATVENV